MGHLEVDDVSAATLATKPCPVPGCDRLIPPSWRACRNRQCQDRRGGFKLPDATPPPTVRNTAPSFYIDGKAAFDRTCATCGVHFVWVKPPRAGGTLPDYCSDGCRPSTPKFVGVCIHCGNEFRSHKQDSRALYCHGKECRDSRRAIDDARRRLLPRSAWITASNGIRAQRKRIEAILMARFNAEQRRIARIEAASESWATANFAKVIETYRMVESHGAVTRTMRDVDVLELRSLIESQAADDRRSRIQYELSLDKPRGVGHDQFGDVYDEHGNFGAAEWRDPTFDAYLRSEQDREDEREWELELANRGHGYEPRDAVMREWEVMEQDRANLNATGGGGRTGKKSSSGHNSGTRRTNPTHGPSRRTTRVSKDKK